MKLSFGVEDPAFTGKGQVALCAADTYVFLLIGAHRCCIRALTSAVLSQPLNLVNTIQYRTPWLEGGASSSQENHQDLALPFSFIHSVKTDVLARSLNATLSAAQRCGLSMNGADTQPASRRSNPSRLDTATLLNLLVHHEGLETLTRAAGHDGPQRRRLSGPRQLGST